MVGCTGGAGDGAVNVKFWWWTGANGLNYSRKIIFLVPILFITHRSFRESLLDDRAVPTEAGLSLPRCSGVEAFENLRSGLFEAGWGTTGALKTFNRKVDQNH